MPFSKRHRGKRSYGRQKLCFPLSQSMSLPPALPNAVTPLVNGINEGNVVVIPANPTANLEAPGGVLCAETPLSSYIGTYNFNFSRLLAHTIGGNEAGGGTIATLGAFFKRMKFGVGYMTIERVDTGATGRYVSTTALPDGGPVGGVPLIAAYSLPKPVELFIYYIRLNPHESTFSQSLLSNAVFKADPRCRRVRLMPGRSVTFKFRPLRFSPPSYVQSTIRDWASAFGRETDQYRRAEIPSKGRALGWFPTGVAIRENTLALGAGVGQGGLGADVFQIVSPTLALLFETDQVFQLQLNGQAGQWFGTDSTNATDSASNLKSDKILLRRREFSTACFSEFCPPTQRAEVFLGYSGVGQILQVSPYNGSTTSYNTIECFDPPRLTSLSSTTVAAYGLWRPGQAFGPTAFVPTAVPLDLESAPIVDKPAPTIPGVGAVP